MVEQCPSRLLRPDIVVELRFPCSRLVVSAQHLKRVRLEVRRRDVTSFEALSDLIALQRSQMLSRVEKRGQQEACGLDVARLDFDQS